MRTYFFLVCINKQYFKNQLSEVDHKQPSLKVPRMPRTAISRNVRTRIKVWLLKLIHFFIFLTSRKKYYQIFYCCGLIKIFWLNFIEQAKEKQFPIFSFNKIADDLITSNDVIFSPNHQRELA